MITQIGETRVTGCSTADRITIRHSDGADQLMLNASGWEGSQWARFGRESLKELVEELTRALSRLPKENYG